MKKITILLLLCLCAYSINAQNLITFLEFQKEGVSGVSGLRFASDPVVSPDGKHVYVASVSSAAVSIFERDAVSGALTFLNQVTGISGSFSVDISPNGNFVYVASPSSNSIHVFTRDASTGLLTFVEQKTRGGGLTIGSFVMVQVSPDNKHLYGITGSNDDGIAVFSIDQTTGALTFVEEHLDDAVTLLGQEYSPFTSPINNIGFAANGAMLYFTSSSDNAVLVYNRDITTGAITLASSVSNNVGGVSGIGQATSLLVSSDEKNVYVTGQIDNSVVVFTRDTTTGALTFLEKHTDGVSGLTDLGQARSLASTPDGRYVYVSALTDNAVNVFERNQATGALTFATSVIDGVGGVDGLASASGMVTDKFSQTLYLAGQGDNALAVFQLPIPSVLLNNTMATANENGMAVTLDGTLTVLDSDDTDLESATITISNGFITTDMLSITPQGGITSSYINTTGVLTLTGIATLADYQETLRTLAYQAGDDPSISIMETSERVIEIQVSDGTNDSGAAEITVTVNGEDTLGITNEEVNMISIYPIPTSGIINITTNKNFKFNKIEILDLTGKSVYFQKLGSDIAILDISNVSPGIYLMKFISTSGITAMKKIIKK